MEVHALFYESPTGRSLLWGVYDDAHLDAGINSLKAEGYTVYWHVTKTLNE